MCFTARPRREEQSVDRTKDDVWHLFERSRDEAAAEPTPILDEPEERQTESPERSPLTTAS